MRINKPSKLILIFAFFTLFVSIGLASQIQSDKDEEKDGRRDITIRKQIVCLRKAKVSYPDISVLVKKSDLCARKYYQRWKDRIECSPEEVVEHLEAAKVRWAEMGYFSAKKEMQASTKEKPDGGSKRKETFKVGGLDQDLIREIVCMHHQGGAYQDIADHFDLDTERIRYAIRKHAHKFDPKTCEEIKSNKDEVFDRTPRVKYSPEFLQSVVCLFKGGVIRPDLLEVFSLQISAFHSLVRRHLDKIECSDETILRVYEEAKKIKPVLCLSKTRVGLLHTMIVDSVRKEFGLGEEKENGVIVRDEESEEERTRSVPENVEVPNKKRATRTDKTALTQKRRKKSAVTEPTNTDLSSIDQELPLPDFDPFSLDVPINDLNFDLDEFLNQLTNE